MFSRTRSRLTYANVAATLALFFAMTGGALAAGHYLITSPKQIKPSVLASLKGATGKNGTPGTNGAAGPIGATGPAGPQGSPGSPGASGASVTSAESKTAIGPCPEGGSEFTAGATNTYACNGKKGVTGFTKVLPAGKTETGMWTVTGGTEFLGSLDAWSPISFPIPLATTLAATNVHYVSLEEEEGTAPKTHAAECPGTAAEPKAEAQEEDNLCIYTQEDDVTAFRSVTAETVGGIVLKFVGPNEGFSHATGSYAITAGHEG